MPSTSLGERQRGVTWDSLPREIRLHILEALMQDGCSLASLATVSREWQTNLERHNFARIKLTLPRLADFGSMIHRNRALVRYIWFCFELDEYDCTQCQLTNPILEGWDTSSLIHNTLIFATFEDLLSVISMWDPLGDLVLDISFYSPSDSKHWFKYLTFVPDGSSSDVLGDSGIKQMMAGKVYDDPQHGWVGGFRHSTVPFSAIEKVFDLIDMLDEGQWDQLPTVPAVTGLLLRQQNRRRWEPASLAHMLALFPRLQEIHYEPWMEWDPILQGPTDQSYHYLFNSISHYNTSLKRLVVFENFNEQYLSIRYPDRHIIRNSSPANSRAVARASLNLEHLAASFIIDASYFFEGRSSWEWDEWPNLISLVITSRLLTPNEDSVKIGYMLRTAAAAAMKMPQLEKMEIWNGRKGLAALFKYHAFRDEQQAIITWKGTWELNIEPSTIKAWEAVVNRHGDWWRLDLVQERLDKDAIKSHGDSIHYLKLASQVIRPISLQQIQEEQKAREGVEILEP